MLEIALYVIWIGGWVAATVFAAAVIGNVDNARPGDRGFPAFILPLFFGFLWPVALALLIIMAPLMWLADRADKRHDREAEKPTPAQPQSNGDDR